MRVDNRSLVVVLHTKSANRVWHLCGVDEHQGGFPNDLKNALQALIITGRKPG